MFTPYNLIGKDVPLLARLRSSPMCNRSTLSVILDEYLFMMSSNGSRPATGRGHTTNRQCPEDPIHVVESIWRILCAFNLKSNERMMIYVNFVL